MAKGKRVSNKPGGKPGRRSTKGRQRFLENRRRKRAIAASNSAPVVPETVRGRGPAHIKKPPVISRAISHVKRFFRRGVQ
jgi:hypothetical protein